MISDNDRWHLSLLEGEGNYIDNQFNLYGEYTRGEPAWRNNERYIGMEVMMYNITDLNTQDEFIHSNSIFSKDLMLYDDDNVEDYQVIKYCDDFLVQFDNNKSIVVTKGERKLSNEKYAMLKPCFLFKPKEVIECTLEATTQYGRSILSGPTIHNKFKSPFPANNVIRQHEAVATDSVKASVPTIDTGGIVEAKFYIGRESLERRFRDQIGKAICQ